MEDRLSSVSFSDGGSQRRLVFCGSQIEDLFSFKVELPEKSVKHTKRNVLGAIATLFDPLQFLSPFTVRAKVLMQEIWTAGIETDEELPSLLKRKWKKWVSEFHSYIRVHNSSLSSQPKRNLHSATSFLRSVYRCLHRCSISCLLFSKQQYNPTVCLIASMSLVALLKAITLPRKELMEAGLSNCLSLSILKTLSIDQAFYWPDSLNVYYWIHNHSRSYKPTSIKTPNLSSGVMYLVSLSQQTFLQEA